MSSESGAPMSQQDVSVIYQGASGGFLLFYYLLLTGHYAHGIQNNLSVRELITNQFPRQLAQDRKNWKTHEFWPDNWWARETHNRPRLYLICNPFFEPTVQQRNQVLIQDTFRILLYTDLKIQLRLAWEKQAWWFTSVSRQRYQQGTERDYIRWIKNQGPVDPDVQRIRDAYQPNCVIRLEDFVKDPMIFGSPPSAEQRAFVLYWLSLQSAKSQRLLSAD